MESYKKLFYSAWRVISGLWGKGWDWKLRVAWGNLRETLSFEMVVDIIGYLNITRRIHVASEYASISINSLGGVEAGLRTVLTITIWPTIIPARNKLVLLLGPVACYFSNA
jgi:hypothetical protein